MELLARIGIKVSNASSSLTEEQAEQFYESINFKRGDKDADNSGSANAADKTAAARAAAAQSAQGGIKDPKQAQPVIRRVVVHNSGSRSDSYSNKSGGSVQAPSGLRQGLVLTQPKPKDKAEDAAPAEPAPEAPAKTGGGVRRIPRKAPASGTPAAAPAADKAPAVDTAAPAAETASAPAAEATAENKPAVKRIRRVGKPEGEAAAAPAASAAAENAPDKTGDKPADKVEVQPAAPEKAPETAAASAPDKAAETTAAAPAKAVDAVKPAKSEASAADNASEKAEGAANVSDKAAKAAEKTEKAADAAPAPDKAPDTAPAAKTEKAEPAAAAPASAAAKTPAADAAKAAAPVRRGPVYISRARDAAPGTRPAAAADTRTPARTGRPAGAGTGTFARDKGDQKPPFRTGAQGEGARGYQGQGGSRAGGPGAAGQGRGRGPAIPSVNPSVAQQEPRRDYAGKLFDKGEKNLEKTVKPANKRDASRTGGAKVKYREERNLVGATIGVNDLYADNYHAGYDPDDTHAQKRSARTGRKDVKGETLNRAPQPPVSTLTNVTLPASMTVKEFAELIKKTAAEVIKKLMLMGTMATQNQVIDFDTAQLIASEFGIEAEQEVVVTDEERLFDDSEDENDEGSVERPPVVVVMGHVDHGKTSLLDAIRSTSVTAGEAGGITQHIGAYMVRIGDRKITFLDTPGHEAFTAMRQRGAMVTDVAILVVAADDGVMPQTIEAINHAKAAKVSIVVAVNKMDKEGANLERVMTELAKYDVVSEDWGGDVPFVPVSAKTGMNIQLLLETVLLSADVLQLRANPDKQAKGTIIEAKLDRNKGPVATLLVQRGTLRTGDAIISGVTFGRVRTMTDDKGKTIKKAGPSTPVEITGLPEVPEAGEVFYVVEDEHLAKHLVESRRSEMREKSLQATTKVSLENLNSFIEAGKMKDLNIIVKADVVGSVEAVKQSLTKLSNDEVRINIIHGAVGAITESDVSLADVSNAIIIGFNVRPGANISESAKAAGVDIKLYRVIYDAIDDIKAAIAGMLSPKFQEVIHGHAQVRQTFKVSGVGTIAGAYVTDGDIVRNSEVRIVRDGIVVFEGKLASLKRFKDDVKEVATGYECGLSFENFNDVKIDDTVECYTMEEVKKA